VLLILIERIQQVFAMSSQQFEDGFETENFLYVLVVVGSARGQEH
jgi:hypothetical protein